MLIYATEINSLLNFFGGHFDDKGLALCAAQKLAVLMKLSLNKI